MEIAERCKVAAPLQDPLFTDTAGSIVTLYSGSEIGGSILNNWGIANGWRWGYGMWCIINVICAVPFLSILYSWTRRAARTPGLEPLPPYRGAIAVSDKDEAQPPLYKVIVIQAFHEYDVVGIVLLVAGVSLILTPLSIAGGASALWTSSYIAMEVIGFVFVCFFVLWYVAMRRQVHV